MMLANFLNLRAVQFSLTGLIILVTAVCLVSPNYFYFLFNYFDFRPRVSFAILIMLGYLMLGMVFLVLKQPRLMFTSLASCAVLCLFLKHSSNSDLRHPLPTNGLSIKVAHFNVSVSDPEQRESTIQAMLKTKADLISVEEVTPLWRVALLGELGKKYPHSTMLDQVSFGLAVFSKHPFVERDTFYHGEIPNLSGIVEMKRSSQRFKFVCANTKPPLYGLAYDDMKKHLNLIADRASEDSMAVLTIGNYNAPPWWTEIQNLRETAGLSDSRRSSAYGFSEIFQRPGDYILYTDHFNCLKFKNITSPESIHLGIQGRYQFKPHDQREN